ncbi:MULTISPECIES: heavy metal translocating P-type ATPase [unclassified Herbaspirillum]|uniref:heavy metal translocating P-type ATPase n=1 Tax=unclassified Herbaspirillum TaxID=2624150 RepID=UPI001151EE57|nr:MULTISPECIES: heavy metal translocating P-type ATPase [unclassified Herbaspirillum]MBB5390981.1 Cd2+/Zn2+-exporting ATPase [Herbaspirillum sp. SJZ102]TQK06501.1 Cd2+/Zn2+-exporting ATPase [Herbaspirillum sp. SJZ130]TQK12021.1 Cd2+/Zn2+-exporting ATPase [Herbaspirillum sp. SJZ106]
MAAHQHGHHHSHDHDDHDHAHHDHSHAHADGGGSCCGGHAHAALQTAMPAARRLAGDTEEAVFFIQKMDCPTEEKLIRERLGQMNGVGALEFNLIQRELTVQHQLPSIAPIVATLKALDMLPAVKSDSLDASAAQAGAIEQAAAYRIPARRWVLLGLAGIAALGSEIVAWTSGDERSLPVIALALLGIALGGLGTLKKGWIALRNFSLNMNFLMSLAVIGAAVIGQWPEAAVVIVLFTLAEMIEALSLERARNAIAGLMAMSPDLATVRGADGSWASAPAREVAIDAIVRVAPGERVPLDGVITEGATSINQAPITGESIPVAKQSGDTVFAGTINEHGAFVLRVTAAQGDSTLSRIVKSVQQAQGQRAPTQRFVDRFAQVYIPAVVAMAVLVAVLPPLLLGADFHPWLYKALVLLVIACPCALVISTPVTIVSGLAAAARHGILVKGGVYLEQGRKLRALALDKTGTITFGKPAVTDVVSLAPSADQDALLQLAVSLAARSDHPVSRAIAARQGAAALEVSDFEALAGRGVRGRIGGELYHLGNHRLVHELGMCSPALEARLQAFEKQGKTTTLLCRGAKPQLLVAVADTVRPSSREAVADLQQLGVHVVMLTGDNPHTAQAIAAQTGIDDARGDQLPDDKLKAVEALDTQYGEVGMVGDGINDAPALARARIGFAMGAAGTDTALETADVALMDDDLRKIPDFIRLSNKAHAVLVQNIAIALGIKAVFLALALAGMSSLWMAVFADMGASLIVVFNGLRLVRGVPSRVA